MLIPFSEMLRAAHGGHTAVGSFNVYNFSTIRGVIESGEAELAPVIVAFGAKYLANMDASTVVAVVADLAAKSSTPVCLHLDHCSDLGVIRAAIDAGFGSVMYDGSKLPFEDNVARTKQVCGWAHAAGIGVEAELGSLATGEHSHEGEASDVENYTDPEKAAEFCSRTGADALAVSIGTVHGLYKGEPHIRIDILEAIDHACGLPLVLHGGSGTPAETLHACLNHGICKVNVNTEISMHVMEKTRILLGDSQPHFSQLSLQQTGWVKEVVAKYINLFR